MDQEGTLWFTYQAYVDGDRVTKRTNRSPESLVGHPIMVVSFDANGNWKAAGVWGSNEIPAAYIGCLKYQYRKAKVIAQGGGSNART